MWIQGILILAIALLAVLVASVVISQTLKLEAGSSPGWILFLVKNQADQIEFFVRKAVWRAKFGFRDIEAIIVVDDSSSDETPQVLERLARDFPLRHVRLDVSSLGRSMALAQALEYWSGKHLEIMDLR